MAKSTGTKKQRKVPLSIHKASGLWCKVHNGRRIYFEKLAEDPDGKRSLEQWQAIKTKRARAPGDVVRLKTLCNEWLAHKQAKLDAAEICQDTWDEYHRTCVLAMATIDKETDAAEINQADFARLRRDLAKRFGPVALGKHIGQVRSLFKYGYEAGLIDRPALFGPDFVKPSAKVLRKQRLKRGDQDFSAEEIRRLLDAASTNWRAMILLGVQAGFGNRDVAELTADVIDLDSGWIDYPRHKTATRRRVPLWPETLEAIRKALAEHPGGSERLFVGPRGRDYTDANKFGNNRVSRAFGEVLKAAGFPESGRKFYGLRRTFQTQAEESGDIVAVKAIMGHIPPESDMSARYRQRVSDERLRRTVDVVRAWLFGDEVAS